MTLNTIVGQCHISHSHSGVQLGTNSDDRRDGDMLPPPIPNRNGAPADTSRPTPPRAGPSASRAMPPPPMPSTRAPRPPPPTSTPPRRVSPPITTTTRHSPPHPEAPADAVLLPSNPAPPAPVLRGEAAVEAWPQSAGYRGFIDWLRRRCERIKGKPIIDGEAAYEGAGEVRPLLTWR